MYCYALFCFIAVVINGAFGYSDGAPKVACDSMHPSRSQHGPDDNDGKTPPYDVLFLDSSKQEATCYSPGKTYYIRVIPKDSKDQFKGFLIEGRDSSDKAVGKFVGSGDVQVTCSNDIAATHTGSDSKSKVDAQWSITDAAGTLTFKATVVVTRPNYYVQIPSKSIKVCS